MNLLSYTAIPDLVSAIVCFACFARLWTTIRTTKDPSRQTYHFRDAYLFLVLAYLAFSLPVFFLPTNTQALGAAFVAAHGFFFVASANLVAIPVSFFWPQYHRAMYFVTMLIALALVVLGFMNLPEPQVNFFLHITHWNTPDFLDILYGVWLGISLLFAVFFFIQQTIVSQNRAVRIRAFFIGSGLLFMLVAAVVFYIFDFNYEAVYTNVFSVIGLFLTLIGVYYRPREAKEQFLPNID